FETEEGADLVLFGVLDGEEPKYAIRIPYALSILAHGLPDSEVTGLNEFPKDEVPPLWIHYLFDTMVSIGMWLAFISFVYFVASWRGWKFIKQKWFLWLTLISGPLALVAIEAGWWFTEVGRQPWILRGYMTVEEAATTSGQVDLMIILFAGLYFILGIGTIVVLLRMYKRNPIEKELADREAQRDGGKE